MESTEIGRLCLGVKDGESIFIGDIKVRVVGGPVRLEVTAPKNIPVDRESVRERKAAA